MARKIYTTEQKQTPLLQETPRPQVADHLLHFPDLIHQTLHRHILLVRARTLQVLQRYRHHALYDNDNCNKKNKKRNKIYYLTDSSTRYSSTRTQYPAPTHQQV